ncbi:4-(cytidine 5'-diphospho)-2-C-methyl-D-erythritol kinase [Roseibium algae]|uniref:4-diphosphocytidyl-2-C-methyl-D-erythritol kinase n=1 Tax=Roseibium algae TaxID=3123038 RepID=A0ABU8TMW3_9HYPH
MPELESQKGAGEFARAKVNLALHITGQRDDGYHMLDSLVVFPRIGDHLSATPSDKLSLEVTGPFSTDLEPQSNNNLVLKAIRRLSQAKNCAPPDINLSLEKNLPVASGIGGGSADAAAALRLLMRQPGFTLASEDIHAIALELGADVPVCLKQVAVRMQGIGELLSPLPSLPDFGMVIANPRVAVSTPAIFKGLQARNNPSLPDLPESFASLDQLIVYLRETRNDMQVTAEALCPAITDVLSEMDQHPETLLNRMSGSGATCFALCRCGDEKNLAARIQKSHPDWWVAFSDEL